jgi:hypothetical protein
MPNYKGARRCDSNLLRLRKCIAIYFLAAPACHDWQYPTHCGRSSLRYLNGSFQGPTAVTSTLTLGRRVNPRSP